MKIFTFKDGWVWLFTVIEHWNGEVLGFHFSKRRDPFAALAPISSTLKRRFGYVERGIARGLELCLRMDNGSQYRSENFLNQLKNWGIRPIFGYLREPEINGVIKRYHRTLKEQVTLGAEFEDLEIAREEIGRFVRKYNREWLLAKLGYRSPLEAKKDWEEKHAA